MGEFIIITAIICFIGWLFVLMPWWLIGLIVCAFVVAGNSAK